MYNVLDVCRFVINYSNKTMGISNLKLQKILYFIQASFLIQKGIPCFSEVIEAWEFGPVVPSAYHEYKQYGSGNIPVITHYYLSNSDNFWDFKKYIYDDNIISSDDKEMIKSVVDFFSNYSATTLVQLTHAQTPWKSAYYLRGKNAVIDNDCIKEYFSDK